MMRETPTSDRSGVSFFCVMPRARMTRATRCARWLLFALLCSGCGATLSVPVQEPPVSADPYVEALVERALALDLAHSVDWLRLGHYRQGLLGPGFLGGGYASQADGPEFFLSPSGKQDPAAE